MVLNMKNVFVYINNHNIANPYTVIWKETGVKQDLDDIMLFNGEFKRYQNIKGWHGIISDEINYSVIHLMQEKYTEVKTFMNLYYPRYLGTTIALKKANVIRFLPKRIMARGTDFMHNAVVTEWCKPWRTDDFADEQVPF